MSSSPTDAFPSSAPGHRAAQTVEGRPDSRPCRTPSRALRSVRCVDPDKPHEGAALAALGTYSHHVSTSPTGRKALDERLDACVRSQPDGELTCRFGDQAPGASAERPGWLTVDRGSRAFSYDVDPATGCLPPKASAAPRTRRFAPWRDRRPRQETAQMGNGPTCGFTASTDHRGVNRAAP